MAQPRLPVLSRRRSVAVSRRRFLQGGSALALLAAFPPARLADLVRSASAVPGGGGYFLDAHQMATLRAVTARFIPGPTDGPGPLNAPPAMDPGAAEGKCAEAIDILLAAFAFDPPVIHAGGPFSNRAGSTVDDFAQFVPLDAHAALGWRIRIEGSRGIAAREFAGPVTGLQEIYSAGLATLDQRARSAGGSDFAAMPAEGQDVILVEAGGNPGDPLNTFVATALSQTFDAMYGPPEYGGNVDLVGWTISGFEGDVQPRGHSDEEVTQSGGGTLAVGADVAGAIASMRMMGGRPASQAYPWLALAGFARG